LKITDAHGLFVRKDSEGHRAQNCAMRTHLTEEGDRGLPELLRVTNVAADDLVESWSLGFGNQSSLCLVNLLRLSSSVCGDVSDGDCVKLEERAKKRCCVLRTLFSCSALMASSPRTAYSAFTMLRLSLCKLSRGTEEATP
jgi:hypothetical protein